MKTFGAKRVTATSFAKVRHLQTNSDADWTEIQRLTGHGRTTQQKIKRAISYDRYTGIPALKRRADRIVQKLAVKKQIIERNTKAKAARINVEHVVVTPADLSALRDEFEATKRQLAQMVREDRKTRKTTISRMIDDELDKRFSEAPTSPLTTPEFDDAMLADWEHNKPRKSWFKRAR